MKNCPNKETLFGYLTGSIPEGLAGRVGEHLAECQECERTVQALEGLSDTVLLALRHRAKGDALADEAELRQAVSQLQRLTAAKSGSSPPEQIAAVSPAVIPSRTVMLGDYELLKKLGQGGMGTVYQARHTKLKRIVALKVLPKNRLSSPEAVVRFEREMEAVGRLDHPNIVRAMDAREVAGVRFLVMEYVDGLDLAEVTRRCGALAVADACEVIRQAALGLQCSQENGLVHRDIKPSNLMLTSSGEVKILDLGLAHIQEAEPADGEVTGAGQVMGTPDYMSPEQALESRNVDVRTDIYSLGCTFYRLLVDRVPFSGPKYDSAMKKVAAHLQDEATPVQLLRPDVPKPIAGLIECMLRKNPDDRPRTPAVIVDTLMPLCSGNKLIALLRQARRAPPPAADAESSRVETDDLRAAVDIETSREGPVVATMAAAPTATAAAPFDAYHRWLGIAPAEQPAHHYRMLGLAPLEDDPEVIRDAAVRQMAHVRTYQLGQHAELSQKILNELAAAKACLLHREKKAAYDAKLRVHLARGTSTTAEPAVPHPVVAELSHVSATLARPATAATRARAFARRHVPPNWQWIACAAAACCLFFSVVIYVATEKGRVRIAINDVSAPVLVKVDGNTIDIAGLQTPLQLRPGEHELQITGDGFQTISRSFTVRRGDNPAVEITLEPRVPAGTAAVVAPPAPPMSDQRWLGYDPGTGVRTRLSHFAGYTNFGSVPCLRSCRCSICSRRAAGLKLLLPVDTRASMTELLSTKTALLKSEQDVVVGVLACCPSYFGITASELADFGRDLKGAFPQFEFWVALADGGKDPPSFVLPATADYLVIDALDCGTRAEVERRAQRVWPKWIAKAAGRRVVLCWDSWQRNSSGLVATCQPHAIRACGEAVDRLNLQGIMFSTYGDNQFGGSLQLGIETRMDLISEVQAIARRWTIRPGTPAVVPPATASPAPLQTSLPTRLSHVVVITGEDITAHRWREMSLALRDVLQADRRLAVDVMPDPNFLADDKLFNYQVAVLNFRNEKPLTQEQRPRQPAEVCRAGTRADRDSLRLRCLCRLGPLR